jgi:hypothetical protein
MIFVIVRVVNNIRRGDYGRSNGRNEEEKETRREQHPASDFCDLCLRNSEERDGFLWPKGEQEGQKELSGADIAPPASFRP